MTKAELIARLGENKDTPFYKSNYNVEEVIELLKTMDDSTKEDFISLAYNDDTKLDRALNYVEEYINENGKFKITRCGEYFLDMCNGYLVDYFGKEFDKCRGDLNREFELSDDAIEKENAYFEITNNNEIEIEGGLEINSYEVDNQVETLLDNCESYAKDIIETYFDDCYKREQKAQEEAEQKAREEAESTDSTIDEQVEEGEQQQSEI